MKKSYAKKLGLCVALALSAGVLLPTGVVEAKNYTAPITGNSRIDGQRTTYKDVLKNGVYTFGEDTTIEVGNNEIAGGKWLNNISTAVSGAQGKTPVINMNHHTLTVTETNSSGAATGIAAIGNGSSDTANLGKVTINNAGNMRITARGTNVTAGLFANSSGEIYIDNDSNGAVLTVDGKSTTKSYGVGIKTMNGVTGTSKITVTGLVDVTADGQNDGGYSSNEAVSAVASTIDLGGGYLKAINGAWAAIRAYGEFVTPNYGVVNFNVTKDKDGNPTGAGNHIAQITGDLVTNGGMGTKGRINVGLNGKDSWWEGNYADTRGYGETPGEFGAVNLFMKNGSHWLGFGNGSMNIQMDGSETYWNGFGMGDSLQLTLNNGSTWYNAITPTQKDQSGNAVEAKIAYLNSRNGIIDMTGEKGLYVADGKSLNGNTTASDPSHFVKVTDTSMKSGNVIISSFTGDATVRYAHDTSAPTTIYGGNVTIASASSGSIITATTDNNGIDTTNSSVVNSVLNALKNKLIYSASDTNLTKYAQIEEGLTSTSVFAKIAPYAWYTSGNKNIVQTANEEDGKWTVYDTCLTYDDNDFWLNNGIQKYDEETGTRTYTFDSDTKIIGSWPEVVMWWSSDPTSKAIIDLSGHDFYVTTTPESDTHGILTGLIAFSLLGDDGPLSVEVKNPGEITLEGTNIDTYKSGVISLYNDVDFHIYNSNEKSILKINSIGKASPYPAILNQKSKIVVDGLVDINNFADAISTWGDNSYTSIGGGKISNVTNFIKTSGKGDNISNMPAFKSTNARVDFDVKTDDKGNVTGVGDRYAKLEGDINNQGIGSIFNIGLGTADSYWKGTAINSGDSLNLYMANGSTWTNTGASTVKSITADKSYIVMGKDASLHLGSFSGNADIFYQMNGKDIQGGDVTIANATKGSSLSMVADVGGTDITTDDYVAILDNLAKKLYYTAGDTHLSGYVKIAEGLTSASVTKALGGIDFDSATGQGSYEKFASSQSKFSYSTAIKGHMTDDMDYVKTGVLDTATNTYNFIKNETTITAENSTVSGGPWVGRVGSAVAGIDDTTTLDMHGHTLTVRAANAGHSTGITAIGTRGKVEINNAGVMDISASGTGQTAALFVNGGGQIAIHNGDSDKAVLRLRANASNKANGAVIKSMNGVANAASQITIDGLVDVVADGQNSNEAVSAVASTINIGGGIVTAEDGAAWAIRAYGEFLSKNVGIVNINTTQDSAGNMNGAGSRKTQITGDLSTAGGMGNKGQINIGLSGKDSFLKGDYATAIGTEVEAHTQAATGLNLYLSNGADWTGNTKGSTTLTMNANTTWHGQSTSNEMAVNMKGAGTWYNTGASTIKHWTSQRYASQAATIDMTDSKAGDVSIDNYNGNTFVIYKHNEATPSTLTGGHVTIKHADAGSSITMSTDNTGIDTNNIYAVDSVLSALAEKLTYSGYIGKAEDNLKGYVQIAEGLTARSAAKATGNIQFSEKTGQGSFDKDSLAPSISYPSEQGSSEFGTAITGDKSKDTEYLKKGVLSTDTGEYTFTKESNTITGNNHAIAGGAWLPAKITAAVSGEQGTNTIIHANRNKLQISEDGSQGRNGTTGISAIGLGEDKPEKLGKVIIKDAGNMTITTRGSGVTSGLFANSSGEIYIDNAGKDANGNDYVLKIDSKSKAKASSAGIKTMNGMKGTSKITVTGLVDVVADGEADENGFASNEAISAVASTIDIGGGNIAAINGAWAAIRAYGEFVTQNTGTVYVNVKRDDNGKMVGAGNNKTTITGDFVTNGGMGTKGQINVGLNGKDSFWEGNYADTRGYGVTQGQLGAVNLFMKDGAHWKGFANGAVNAKLEGKDTYWYGFGTSENTQLTLKDGATWINAITPDQLDQSGKPVESHIGYLTSDNGFIDMTGRKVFVASSKSLSGSTTGDGASAITESENGITGNLTINDYSGSATILYRRDAASPTDVLGGNVTVKKAADNSVINLRTDGEGLDYHDTDTLLKTFKNLANKLYYTEEVEDKADTAEVKAGMPAGEGDVVTDTTLNLADHLKGTVGINEGLTNTSATVKLADIIFQKDKGQGTIKMDPSSIKTGDKSNIIYGDKETAMMRGAKSAMTTSMLSWRSDMTDMTSRVGDLHYGAEDGIWARTFGGKVKYDKDNAKVTNSFWGAQIGADKLQKNGWHVGGAFDYNKGNAKYDKGGEGDSKLYTFSLYGSKLFDDGQYLDVVAKVGHTSNDYTVYNDSGYKLDGDYSATGYGISAEYGKRFGGEKGFIEPQVQLTLSRLGSADYDAVSNYAGGKKMHVSQDGMTSFIGRLGVAAGKATDKGNFYLKASLLHEFSGKTTSTFSAEGEATSSVDQDFGDTWAELALGGTYRLSPSSMLYADITKSFGGDYEVQWKANAGVRFTF